MSLFRGDALPSPPGSLPPPSPRKRRRECRESEDAEGDMTIEEYLYRIDPFRSVSFSNPGISPRSEFLPDDENPARSLLADLDQVLRAHSRLNDAVGAFHFTRATREDDSFYLLHVSVAGPGSSAVRLGPLKDDVVGLLHRNGLSTMHVEVINTDHWHDRALFPLQSGHPLSRAYEAIRLDIIKLLHEELGHRWQTLCPFEVGRDVRSSQPNIVIFVQPASCANWMRIRTLIERRLAVEMSPAVVDIEFLPGKLELLRNETAVSFRDRINKDGDFEMGDSIGIHGDDNAGTLGGYMTLRYDGQIHHGFLTCAHVVRPSPAKASHPEDQLEIFDRKGILPDSHGVVISMEALAKQDRDRTIEDIDATVSMYRAQEARFNTSIENSLMIGETPKPSITEELQRWKDYKVTLEAARRVIHPMPYRLGDVIFASGRLLHGTFRDWAFVELSPQAHQRCFGTNRMPAIPREQIPLTHSAAPLVCPPGNPIREFSSIRPQMFGIKKDRATNVTGGLCNETKATCNWWSHPVYDIDGNAVAEGSKTSEEFAFVGTLRDFGQDGDSGSLVLDADEGTIAGMVFARVRSEQVGTYASVLVAASMPDIVESMRLRSNASISLELP